MWREAFEANFDTDAEALGKIDALFAEIEKLGAKCKDMGEFEAEFAKSPLNQQYLDLFTEIVTKGVAKNTVKGAEFVNNLVARLAMRRILGSCLGRKRIKRKCKKLTKYISTLTG